MEIDRFVIHSVLLYIVTESSHCIVIREFILFVELTYRPITIVHAVSLVLRCFYTSLFVLSMHVIIICSQVLRLITCVTHIVKLKLILNYPKRKELCCIVFLLAV